MPLQTLAAYGLSAERGFLSDFEIDEIALPADFGPVEDAGDRLSDLITSGEVRRYLGRLFVPDIDSFLKTASDAQVRRAMVRYSFLVQAYVWGESAPPAALPRCLAYPMHRIAEHLGQAPLLPYSGYVLDNWYRLDKSKPVSLDNIGMYQNFLGGADENWFVLVHVAIEAEAGAALDLAVKLVEAVDAGVEAKVEELLTRMDKVWDRINAHFDRMPERCDPYIYFHRVRPYIHGWKNNPALGEGLVYEGVGAFEGRPQAYRGQTGSQSSIVPAMDALFGVQHQNDPLREYLDELHAYRPVPHRKFVDDLRAASRLRAFAEQAGQGVKDAFNVCVEQVARFRTRHLEYAASYINRQASAETGNDTEVGTGGTPFMRYLKKHRDENRTQTV